MSHRQPHREQRHPSNRVELAPRAILGPVSPVRRKLAEEVADLLEPSIRRQPAILQATLDCCREDSYQALTIEGIARRAGVGKQTIYRWWPSKAAVVLESLNELIGQAAEFPDTGSLRDDLRQHFYNLVDLMSNPDLSPLLAGLIAAAQLDPEVAQQVLEEVNGPRFEDCVRRLEQARADGQPRADVDLVTVVETLDGALVYRWLLRTDPVSIEQVNAILDLVFEGLEPPTSQSADGEP